MYTNTHKLILITLSKINLNFDNTPAFKVMFIWMNANERKWTIEFWFKCYDFDYLQSQNENNEHLIFGSHEIKYRHCFLMIDIFWHETWCRTYYIRTTKWKSKCEVLTSNDNCHIILWVSSWLILRYLYLNQLDSGIIVKVTIAEYKCSPALYTRSVLKKTLVTAQHGSFVIR